MLVKITFGSSEKLRIFNNTFLENENMFHNTLVYLDSLNNRINFRFKNYLEGLNFVDLCHDNKFCKDYGITQLDGSIYHHFIPCDKSWCIDGKVER